MNRLPFPIPKPSELRTRADVKRWFTRLIKGGLNFHPDDNASQYANLATGERLLTRTQAARFNAAMRKTFTVCDPYEVGVAVFQKYLKAR